MRVLQELRKAPSITDVFITEFCFSRRASSCTCGLDDHRDSGGAGHFLDRFGDLTGEFSWICRRRAYMSTMRATLDRPSTRPVGM